MCNVLRMSIFVQDQMRIVITAIVIVEVSIGVGMRSGKSLLSMQRKSSEDLVKYAIEE